MNLTEFLNKKTWAISLAKMNFSKRKRIEENIIFQTPFLPQNASIRQRGWHIINNVDSIPICPVCGGGLKFQPMNEYSTYCSRECSYISPDTVIKRMETNIKKHGSIEEYRKYKADTLEKSSLEKYGVKNPFQSDEIKEKIKRTRRGPG